MSYKDGTIRSAKEKRKFLSQIKDFLEKHDMVDSCLNVSIFPVEERCVYFDGVFVRRKRRQKL